MDRVMTRLTEDSGSHFDPHLLERFMQILPRVLSIKATWDARESAGLDGRHSRAGPAFPGYATV